MTATWLPVDFAHPLRVDLSDSAHLRPISADDVDIDMPAVMGNQAMLWAKYGDAWGWPPTTMTADEDREDLGRHAREMVTHESFNYAILPSDESALYGCIYIDPAEESAHARGPAAEVSWWTTADARDGLASTVRAFVPAWLAQGWPFVDVRYPFGEVG
ncbi:GNAT family N-acetyltransferase [Demequina flava]|uniref:GNAT family N-acetyltransferase n=1 Tax=Demequina flava TaxID=1095025 RepID=UPI000784CA14|nr:GNAT family N-acetyltransferase [Demequina flava]